MNNNLSEWTELTAIIFLYVCMNSSLLLLFYIQYMRELNILNKSMNEYGVSYLQSLANFDNRIINVEKSIYTRMDGLEKDVHRRIDNVI